MISTVTDSRFYMWRALFALTHADGIITTEEIDFMRAAIEDVPFSAQQRDILCLDMANEQDIYQLFDKITQQDDLNEFFNVARKVVYADGDYGAEEQNILIKLQEIHNSRTNVDELVGHTTLKLEVEPKQITLQKPMKGENILLNGLKKIFDRLRIK